MVARVKQRLDRLEAAHRETDCEAQRKRLAGLSDEELMAHIRELRARFEAGRTTPRTILLTAEEVCLDRGIA